MDFVPYFILVFSLTVMNSESKFINDDPMLYVYNGEDAREGEFPWMVMIANYQGLFHCGAVLIDQRHVLTAAHCTFGMPTVNPPMISVVMGIVDMDKIGDAEIISRVSRIIRHPNYGLNFKYDFAILQLEREIPISVRVKPICLVPPKLDVEGEIAVVTGWGFYKENSMSRILQKAMIPIWNFEKCKKLYESEDNFFMMESMLCAGDPTKGIDACSYDSGGPLALKYESQVWFLVGIVSWGAECGGDLPGVYGNVSKVHDWIITQTNHTCIY